MGPRVRVLTRKGELTRQRIVAGAAELIREHGVDDVRLEDVMALTRTSKGQLFHYFPGGKEELLIALAEHEADLVLLDQEPALSALDSWEAWDRWRDLVVERYRRQGYQCPMNALLDRISRRSPAAQAVVARLMDQWQSKIADGIRRMQEAGEVAPELDADRTAAAVIAGVQGGVLLMLATGRMDHLEAALDLAIGSLRGRPVLVRQH